MNAQHVLGLLIRLYTDKCLRGAVIPGRDFFCPGDILSGTRDPPNVPMLPLFIYLASGHANA